MKAFWDSRYAAADYAFGEQPNLYLKDKLAELKPGRALFPAEGEGRNAVYAATLGWEVHAFDISEEGRKKAIALAHKHQVTLEYQIAGMEDIDFPAAGFDAIGLIYAHFHASVRRSWHRKLEAMLKPGGHLILEAFSGKHLDYNSVNPQVGGPREAAMLYDIDSIREDFSACSVIEGYATEVELNEGLYHVGAGHVVRFFAIRNS